VGTVSSKAPIGEQDRSTEGSGRSALVTGASSGIGRVLAELFAAKGYSVFLVARREERLVAIAEELSARWGVKAVPLPADLAEPETPERLMSAVVAAGHRVDFLVNNAGYSAIGRYDTHSWDDHARQFRVMGLATLELTHRALPDMVEQRWGRIINVASVAAYFAGTPQDALYGSTKAMVERFSFAIHEEFVDQGIHCTASMPGFTDTDIFNVGGFDEFVDRNPLYKAAMMSPNTVARQAYQGVMDGRSTVIHGVHHKALALAMTHLPGPLRRTLSSAATGRIQVNGS